MSNFDSFLHHPIATLEKALNLRKQISHLEETLKGLLASSPVSLGGLQISVPGRRGGRRKMSAAARARIAAAQRARWARAKGASVAEPAAKVAASATTGKKKGGMSAAGRARIAAAQKARWAKVKAAKGTAEAPAKAKGGKKRKLSPEARARIVAAVKARWAKQKAKA